jgi:hypothetical protein
LSHREWGDATGAYAVLVETTNPAQGRLRGRTDAELVTSGRDRFYVELAARGRLSVPFPPDGLSLDLRVGRHLDTVSELTATLSTLSPDRAVQLDDVPSLSEVVASGLGQFLQPPTAARTQP